MRFLMCHSLFVEEGGGGLGEIAARCALTDVRAQGLVDTGRPAARRQRVEYVAFERAVGHARPPSGVSRSSAAMRRLARKSSCFTLGVLTPTASAISRCVEPCA